MCGGSPNTVLGDRSCVHSKPGLGFELLDDVSDTMPHICIYVGHLFVEGWLFEVFPHNRFEMF